jgi:N4-gp56 family major capsid protein
MASALLAQTSASWSGGDVSAAVSEYWVREKLTRLTPDLVMTPICADGGPGAWLQIPVGAGLKVHFHRLPVLAAATTAFNTGDDDPAATTATLVGVTAIVKQYGSFMVISDMAEDGSFKSAIEYAAEMCAQQMARSSDGLIYAEVKSAGTTAATENGGALAASASVSSEADHGLTMQNLEHLVYTLKNSNVRYYPDGSYKYIAHPATIKTVRALTGTREYIDLMKNIMNKEAISSPSIVGRLAGFTFSETTEITTAATHAATTSYAYENVVAGYESVGCTSLLGHASRVSKKGTPKLISRPRFQYRPNADLIFKGIGSSGTEDPLNRRGSVGWKIRFVAKVLDADRVLVHLAYGGSA